MVVIVLTVEGCIAVVVMVMSVDRLGSTEVVGVVVVSMAVAMAMV